MPNWRQISEEARDVGDGHDVVRRKYLRQLFEYTKRNVIVYYSGWLNNQDPHLASAMAISDGDKSAFMAAVHGMDRSLGLDLILHTPGGDLAAAESLVDYLYQMFDTDIRAIVPQLAMSAGTMIACACKAILLGKHSNLGPIDPQLGPTSAHTIIDGWEAAKRDITINPNFINLYAHFIQRYDFPMLQAAHHAVQWCEQIVKSWLVRGMFAERNDRDDLAARVFEGLSSHSQNKSHSRHIHVERLQELGLTITHLEEDQELQDRVLHVHHACILTLNKTSTVKLIENHEGVAIALQTAQSYP